MNTYDENFALDLLSDARWDQYLDARAADYATYLDLCAINDWSPDDYTFDHFLEDNF
ncbi:MAG: hypothetical protein IK073_05990 [Paludibacteraceae bacterium]|nr:hypothetical protein [Paludibacteraceae bacterium]